jgi:hypothetical protein
MVTFIHYIQSDAVAEAEYHPKPVKEECNSDNTKVERYLSIGTMPNVFLYEIVSQYGSYESQ